MPPELLAPTGRDRRAALRSLARRALRAAEFVTTPLLPTDYGALVAPLHLSADLQGRLVARHRETARAATLVVRPGRGWRPHTPGQYVRVGVDVDGVRHWRAYSITSPPDRPDGCFTITVSRVDGGRVSRHLVDAARPGTLLQLDRAAGEFVLPARPPATVGPVLFLTAGSGITPVMGMLRSHPSLADVVVVHSAPTADDAVFGAELRELHRAGRIRLVERHTARDGILDLSPATGDASGGASDPLDALVPDWRARQTWACGPTAMLDAAEARWEAAGLAHLLHTERFRPAAHAVGEGGVVTFTRTGVQAGAPGDAPLLDAGEDAGVLMPSGCRMGICFGCAAPLSAGSVRDLRTGEVTAVAPGVDAPVTVQTCISAPAGPCSIDL